MFIVKIEMGFKHTEKLVLYAEVIKVQKFIGR